MKRMIMKAVFGMSMLGLGQVGVAGNQGWYTIEKQELGGLLQTLNQSYSVENRSATPEQSYGKVNGVQVVVYTNSGASTKLVVGKLSIEKGGTKSHGHLTLPAGKPTPSEKEDARRVRFS